jgi:hypothetical protein
MRGSIFTLVALGAGAAMTPVILDVDVSGATSQTIVDLLSPMATVIGLAFGVSVFGLFLLFFNESGM